MATECSQTSVSTGQKVGQARTHADRRASHDLHSRIFLFSHPHILCTYPFAGADGGVFLSHSLYNFFDVALPRLGLLRGLYFILV